jgi:ribosomal protein L23
MKELIEKLDAIGAEVALTEEVVNALENAVYTEIGTIEVDENTTDEQIDEAVEKMFSSWKI